MARPHRLPKIKYCGLTRGEDVTAAIACGADAIGLNFFGKSPRYVTPEAARGLVQVASRIDPTGQVVQCVGVFVNVPPSEVDAVLAICPLDCIQLHGEESPDWLDRSKKFASMHSICFIKAIAWRGVDEDRAQAAAWGAVKDDRFLGLLVDAYDPVQRGGTGKTARWDLLYPRPREFGKWPILLAGGLTSENIAQSIEIAKPEGIDVASGIEISPGVKDSAKMRQISDIASRLLPR